MFEYILAGFTGTFFSYFVVFWSGIEFHACCKGVASDKVIKVTNEHNDIQKKKMDDMDRKLNLMLRHMNIRSNL